MSEGTGENRYSAAIGLTFVFNLIVGTGALAIPKAFQEAGILLGLIILSCLAFISYITTTFVIECLSTANALLLTNALQRRRSFEKIKGGSAAAPLISSENNDNGVQPLLPQVTVESSDFEIRTRVELGHMASMFLSKTGVFVFYFCLCFYLFGDLTIYASVVPKSLTQVICTFIPSQDYNISCLSNFTLSDDVQCWSTVSLSRLSVYRLCVVAFGICLGPFVFSNVSKTTALQVLTSSTRWLAFGLMLVLVGIRLGNGHGAGRPVAVNFHSFAPLFGVCVYAFMCQHSLPALLTPIKNKRNLFSSLLAVFSFVLIVYCSIAITAVFSFSTVRDVYTLNFQVACQSEEARYSNITNVAFFEYFLALFPVFTLSSSFPIIGITLRNNLLRLLSSFSASLSPQNSTPSLSPAHHQSQGTPVLINQSMNRSIDQSSIINRRSIDNRSELESEPLLASMVVDSDSDSGTLNASSPDVDYLNPGEKGTRGVDGGGRGHYRWGLMIQKVAVPVAVVVLPLLIALVTNDIEFLVSFTGSYAGVGVQYVMPAWLVLAARQTSKELFRDQSKMPTRYASPFMHVFWPYFVLLWAGLTVVIVTVNYALHLRY